MRPSGPASSLAPALAASTRVSVIIPCRNAAPYLPQTIGSALEQSHRPHEVIVVDDGSTDGSLEVASRFASAGEECVRVIAAPTGHASRTRNLGALHATGDALMFLDADDVLGPDALEALAERLRVAPGAIAVCPWFRLEERGGAWVKAPASCAPRAASEDALAGWLTGWYHPPCSVLWSREAFEQAGRWDEQAAVNQDGDLMMRALARGIPLLETTRGAAFYRRRPAADGSLSGTRRTPTGLAARIRVVRKAAYWLADEGRLDAYRDALATALRAIAADAGEDQPGLRAQALELARRYAAGAPGRRLPGSLRRATRRLVPRRVFQGMCAPDAGASPIQEQASSADEEVRYGLARAAAIDVRAGSVSPGLRPRVLTPAPRPLVSVVLPTYNRAHLLPRTLRSVSAQTFGDFEVLVVDDGSTDDSASVVAAHGDGRVRYLRQPANAGVGAARNRGLREARGDLIAFLDSDDEWLPEKLERQVAVLRDAPDEIGLVYTGVQTVRSDGTTSVGRPQDRGDVYREMLWRNVIHGGGSNVVIRRGVVAAVGFFHEGLSAIEDYEYWLRITRFFRVEFVDEPLIRYHDPRGAERRSLALGANLDARWWMYRRHADEMRRAGVAHLFLLKTVRWALLFPERDAAAVRRLALQAVLEAPASRRAFAMFLRTMVPAAGQFRWIQRHAALE
jgi:O-antigen biosynthesis protein